MRNTEPKHNNFQYSSSTKASTASKGTYRYIHPPCILGVFLNSIVSVLSLLSWVTDHLLCPRHGRRKNLYINTNFVFLLKIQKLAEDGLFGSFRLFNALIRTCFYGRNAAPLAACTSRSTSRQYAHEHGNKQHTRANTAGRCHVSQISHSSLLMVR